MGEGCITPLLDAVRVEFLRGTMEGVRVDRFAYAYEQATMTRLKKLAYEAAIPKTQLVDAVGKGIAR